MLSTAFTIIVPLLPYLEYHINYDVIVNHYCINKDNPDSDCNGACYLENKIHDVHEAHKDSDGTTSENERTPIPPIFAVQSPWGHLNILLSQQLKFYSHHLIYTSPFLNTLFRPPQS